MTVRRLKVPPSVDWVRRRLDRSIRTLEGMRRGFLQRGEPVAAVRISEKINTLQAFRELAFGRTLGSYNASRPLFQRPRHRRKADRT